MDKIEQAQFQSYFLHVLTCWAMLGSCLPCPHPPGQVSPGRELDMDGRKGFSAQVEHFHVL